MDVLYCQWHRRIIRAMRSLAFVLATATFAACGGTSDPPGEVDDDFPNDLELMLLMLAA